MSAESHAPPARHAIVGTAGHIDHGKSALIERLTGIHTDRLPEEKRRGISIELGFAHVDLPSGLRVGIVDVPGHERFVRHMLAGAGGMDLVLLVVAADEGVMPQTREHLDVVDLLGIPDGFVALTKIDLVDDPEWLDVVEADLADVLDGTVLEGRPVLRCSAKTGEGVEAVREEIARRVEAATYAPRGRETRLPIDRVFTIQGFGTVVTGTLWAGTLRPSQRVTLLPSGVETRIKSVEVHDAEVAEAVPGQRVAVSLHRVDRGRVTRGEWLVASDVLAPSRMMDAWLTLARGAKRPLANRARVRVHVGASEIFARVLLLDRDELTPGTAERVPVQLRLETPGVAERGDRFVVRSYSPITTIAGGTIVAPVAAKRRRLAGDPTAELRKLEQGTPLDRLVERLAEAGAAGESPKRLRQATELPQAAFAALVDEARAAGRVIGEGRLFVRRAREGAADGLLGALDRYHAAHPYRFGAPVGELKSALGREMHGDLFDLARTHVVAAGEAVERGGELARSGRPDTLEGAGAETATRLHAALEADGFAPRTVPVLLRDDPDPLAADALSRLVFEGRLVAISPTFALTTERVESLRRRLVTHFEAAETLSVAEARELLDGISRKHLVPLLEYADARGWTRRAGEARVRGGSLR